MTILLKRDLTTSLFYRVSESLIMGTFSTANALAFAPNMQKGIIAAKKIINLLKRIPEIQDKPDAADKQWVKQYKFKSNFLLYSFGFFSGKWSYTI